jgi:hypothetical protein
MRPVRKKPYQDHTFALRTSLELDDDGLVTTTETAIGGIVFCGIQFFLYAIAT